MSQFASGKFSRGLCDRCGFAYKLSVLKEETVRGKPTSLKTCPACWDADHPQNWLGDRKVDDPQALRNPRPDTGAEASRELTGMDALDDFLQGR